jgi:hypothetical protein
MKKLVRENINNFNNKYEVIFFDYGDEEIIVKQKFNSEKEAEDWADSLENEYTDIAIDDDGNDYWKIFHNYYNPEDGEGYPSYKIQLII